MKIYKIVCIFFAFNLMIPMYGMSMFARVRQRLQPGARNMSNKVSPINPAPKKGVSPVSVKMALPRNKSRMDALRKQVTQFLQAQYARLSYLWKTEPALVEQKELAVPVVPVSQGESEKIAPMPVEPVEVAVQKVATASAAQAESDAIIAKLNGENPWDYPEGVYLNRKIVLNSSLAQEIRFFLENNNVDDIENLFFELIEWGNFIDFRSSGFSVLEDMCKTNKSFAIKVFSLIEKKYQKMDSKTGINLLATILLSLPSDLLPRAEKSIEFFFKNVSHYYLVAMRHPDDMARLLPADSKSLVRLIKIICDSITDQFNRGQFASREVLDRSLSFIAKMLNQKIINIKQNDLYALIEILFQSPIGNSLFEKITLNIDSSKLDEMLATYVINNRRALGTSITWGSGILKQYLQRHPEFKNTMIEAMKSETDPYLQFLVWDVLAGAFTGPNFLEKVLNIDKSYAQIPSYRHLAEYYRDLKNLGDVQKYYGGISTPFHAEVIFSPLFTNMVKNSMGEEKELIDAGYDVYYHATRSEYGLFSDIYMMLYSYKSGKRPKNFRFIHFDDPVLGKISEKFLKSGEATRERLLSDENKASAEVRQDKFLGIGQNTLFLTKYLFANLTGPGASPMALMLNNHNWGKELLSEKGEKLLTIKEIFSMFGYLDVYKQYEQELFSLQDKHRDLSPYGELIQIAIPKNNIDKWVYLTDYLGKKITIEIPGIGETSDMNIISDYINKHPQEYLELILIMARSKGGPFDPGSGMQMFTYDLIDPEKKIEFKEKDEEPLLNRILESIKQKDMKDIQEHNAALARE